MNNLRLLLPTGLAAFVLALAHADDARRADEVSFEKDIKPILTEHCYGCHGSEKQRGRLRLDLRYDAFDAGRKAAVITAGDPTKSLMFQLVTETDENKRMPKKADPLSAERIELIRRWIENGADWPEEAGGEAQPAGPAPRGRIELVPLDDEEAAAEAGALLAIRERGGIAGRVAANTIGLDVNLSLAGGDVRDEDLDRLDGCEMTLVWLNLAGTRVTDAGLKKLTRFRELRRLHLERTSIGDEALRHIGRLRKLEYLNLYGTQVTDAGLEELSRLSDLRRLYLWGSKATDAGVEALRTELPDLTIDVGKHRLPVISEADDKKVAEKLPSCCQKAADAGKKCDHPCCIEAAAAGKICPECSAK